MSKSDKELWLFTMRFPFGRSEPFLENELPYLCKRFKRVRIFPLFEDEGERLTPENCEVELLISNPYESASIINLVRYLKIGLNARSFVKASAPNMEVYRKQLPALRARYRQALFRALVLKRQLLNSFSPERTVFYSYWNYDWALCLAILQEMDKRVQFVTRMLGFDMFKFRAPDGWPAFRTYQLNAAKANFIISRAGLKHMQENYPSFSGQYELSFLATHDNGSAPYSPSTTIRIASCSNLVALKRVHLIIEGLKHVPHQVLWTHFGDGPERENLEALIAELPESISVEFKGSVANKQLLQWYSDNVVDLFVHASSTEGGAPVAIQEAASFGIPTVATAVGGIPEIVNEQTGMLLPADLNAAELAAAIINTHQRFSAQPELRHAVRSFWMDNYMADRVYSNFAESLHEG